MMATAHCIPPAPQTVELKLNMDPVEASILKGWMQNPLNPDEGQREAALRELIFTILHNRGVK